MSDLSPNIVVEELQPEGRRYVLPRRDWTQMRWGGIALLVFGFFELLFLVGFFSMMAQAFAGSPPWMAIVFGVFVTPMFVPLAIGMAALFGHSEIEVHHDTLRTIERVSLLRWTRTRRLDQVLRLRVESAKLRDKVRPSMPMSDDDLSAIRIEWGGSRLWLAAIGYPRAMLLPLANELAERCRVASVSSGFADDTHPLAPIEVVDDPRDDHFGDRHDQPTDSKIVVERQPGGVMFNVPAAGIIGGSSGMFTFACLWLGFMTIFTGGVLLADNGPAAQGVAALAGAIAFISLFWLVGIAMMLAAINSGLRRAGIAVTSDQLSILKTSIFGSKSHTWPRNDVMLVRVGPSGVEVNDRPIMELQVIPRDGTKFGLLGGRSVDELAWLATSIREALGVKTSTDVTDPWVVLPDVATQPANSTVAYVPLPQGLTISVPPLGLGRATFGLWIFGIVWMVAVTVFTFFFVRGLDHWFEYLFPLGIGGFMEVAGVLLLGVALHWTIRRVEIAVADGSLLILQTGVTGKKHYEWRRDELLAIRAGSSGAQTNGKPMVELQIVPRVGKQLAFLMGRDNGELGWIATLLRSALDVPAETPDEVAPAPEAPIAEEANT